MQQTDFFKKYDKNSLWCLGGYEPSEWQNQLILKHKKPKNIKTCFGLHPWYVVREEFSQKIDLKNLSLQIPKADMIGELGLDFAIRNKDKKVDLQMDTFEKQLQLQVPKPHVFHIVKAHSQALDILSRYKVKGFVHAFGGPIEIAEQYIRRGLLLSFGRLLLKKSSFQVHEAFKRAPLDKLLLESDAPSSSQSDEDPKKVFQEVLVKAAEIKKINPQVLLDQVQKNFESLFK